MTCSEGDETKPEFFLKSKKPSIFKVVLPEKDGFTEYDFIATQLDWMVF